MTGAGILIDDQVVSVAGNCTSVPLGSAFRLYDDDDFGLATEPLPRNNLVDDHMKSYFRPSFIEVTDARDFNPGKTVPFRKNDDLQTSSLFHPTNTVVNVSKDLTEKDALWVSRITAAYQFSDAEDKDPFAELPTDGGTRRFENYDHSSVFVEACRDWYDETLRLSANGFNPNHATGATEKLKNYISSQASHEIGHQPGNSTGDEEPAEMGLMKEGGADVLNPTYFRFVAKTILRFRQSKNWSKKP